MPPQPITPLPNPRGRLLLNLRQPRLLLRLQLQLLNLLPRLPHTQLRPLQRRISVTLCLLSSHNTFTGSRDGGILAVVAGEKTTAAV